LRLPFCHQLTAENIELIVGAIKTIFGLKAGQGGAKWS